MSGLVKRPISFVEMGREVGHVWSGTGHVRIIMTVTCRSSAESVSPVTGKEGARRYWKSGGVVWEGQLAGRRLNTPSKQARTKLSPPNETALSGPSRHSFLPPSRRSPKFHSLCHFPPSQTETYCYNAVYAGRQSLSLLKHQVRRLELTPRRLQSTRP
jgi:hypothetical protein